MPNKVVTRYSRQCAILYDAVWVFLCFKVLKTSKASVSFQPSFVRTIIAMESSQLARLVLTLQSKTKLRIYLSGVHTKPPVDLAKAIERCGHTITHKWWEPNDYEIPPADLMTLVDLSDLWVLTDTTYFDKLGQTYDARNMGTNVPVVALSESDSRTIGDKPYVSAEQLLQLLSSLPLR